MHNFACMYCMAFMMLDSDLLEQDAFYSSGFSPRVRTKAQKKQENRESC